MVMHKNSISQITEPLAKTSLARLVRFLMMKQTHPGLNLRFGIDVAVTTNYFFKDR
jgi:hypothetical protein